MTKCLELTVEFYNLNNFVSNFHQLHLSFINHTFNLNLLSLSGTVIILTVSESWFVVIKGRDRCSSYKCTRNQFSPEFGLSLKLEILCCS